MQTVKNKADASPPTTEIWQNRKRHIPQTENFMTSNSINFWESFVVKFYGYCITFFYRIDYNKEISQEFNISWIKISLVTQS